MTPTGSSHILERLQLHSSKRDTNQASWWTVAAAVAAAAATASTLAVLAVSMQLQRREKNVAKKSLTRTWSFTSEGMRHGIFPPAVGAPDTIINIALYFDNSNKLPSTEALVEQVVLPMLKYERFFLIPTEGGLRQSQTGYAPDDLVRTVVIPTAMNGSDRDGGESILHFNMYQLLSDPLNVRGRNEHLNELPFWELVRLENKVGRSVVMLRVHHCLGDGLSLVGVFDTIATQLDGSRSESSVSKALSSRGTTTPSFGSVLEAILHALTLGKSKYDDATVFYQQRSNSKLQYNPERKIELFPTVPLEFIKELRKAATTKVPGTTINDMLMCVTSQAIFDYCRATKDDVLASKKERLQCRTLLPVSLPRQAAKRPMCNQFSMVSADLSVGCTTILERLQQIHKTTSFLKTSPRAFIQLWIQNNIVNRLPALVGQQIAHDIFVRHSLVMTNVPGPENTVTLAGQPVTALQLLFPNVIPQVDLVSYAGNIYGNIIYDPTHLASSADNKEMAMARFYAQALVQLGMQFGVVVPKSIMDAAA